ncbi:hypothetical protein VNO77_02090 [Canavalia gladiata]|uniref:Uncharacterized protein n=1 Tax=Canavalia gladiata TaxID=3824 RepID=A0AAN9MXH9_CANGL
MSSKHSTWLFYGLASKMNEVDGAEMCLNSCSVSYCPFHEHHKYVAMPSYHIKCWLRQLTKSTIGSASGLGKAYAWRLGRNKLDSRNQLHGCMNVMGCSFTFTPNDLTFFAWNSTTFHQQLRDEILELSQGSTYWAHSTHPYKDSLMSPIHSHGIRPSLL